MEYGPSDSSGTDGGLPPSHQNRGVKRGPLTANERTIVGSMSYPKGQNDMELQIHNLEQEAYSSVLRAFKAQSDAITWEKESLITELRKELRVSDKEHRELLSCVNADDIILQIREWRQVGGLQIGHINAEPDVSVPIPTVSAPRKRPKMFQPVPSQSLRVPPPKMHSQPAAAVMHPSSSAVQMGPIKQPKGKKPKPVVAGVSSMKPVQYPSGGPNGRVQHANRTPFGALGVECSEPPLSDSVIGQKVWTRWPEDNNFYEAVITEYNPIEGLHALVYDMGSDTATHEWVNLEEISPEDIKWQAVDKGINLPSGRGALGHGIKKSTSRSAFVPGAGRGRGRGRGALKNQSKKDFHLSKNGTGKKFTSEIKILPTERLLKEVEKVFGTNDPDPLEIKKAKRFLKKQERSLMNAITMLDETSPRESEYFHVEHQISHGQLINHHLGRRRNLQFGGNQGGAKYDDDMAVEGGEDSDNDHMAGNGLASDYPHGGDGYM